MEYLQEAGLNQEVPEKTLGEVCLDLKLLTTQQVESAQALERQTGRRLCDILIEQKLVSPEDMAMARSIHLKLPLIDLRKHVIQPDALKLIPRDIARKYTMIPLDIIGDSLIVVMADPEDAIAKDEIKLQARMLIQTAIGTHSDIQRAIDINYKPSADIEKQVSRYLPQIPKEADPTTEFGGSAPIAQILDLLLSQAIKLKASDIHIEPQEDTLRIRFRIDGVIYDMFSLPLGVNGPLSARIKVQAGMDIADMRRPQDGHMSIKIGVKDVDIRVASIGTIYGENLTLRILSKSLPLLTLTQLGFSPDVLEKCQAMLKSPYGMILVGGPAGSGKTTTLYAAINELIQTKQNIMTIEDPIEYRFKGVSQTQVNPKANIAFANGLSALLRHDPDVILVGEIGDKETAAMAVKACIAGHLVLSSIHANNAVGVLFRLIDLGIEPYLISSILVGVVAQRMVRRICPSCRAPYKPRFKEKAISLGGMQLFPTVLYKGEGCNLCSNTGYAGRAGIFELLVMSEEIGRMLFNKPSYIDISNKAIEVGMTTMIRDGLLKVQEGITTVSEVMQTVLGPGAAISFVSGTSE